jgi:NADPH:quinone reductase-like Zn-dependent oxidoreductase
MSNTTMQAIQAHDYGGPEVLVLEEAQRPEPTPDQVLIRLKAAGVNPADWKYRSGAFKQFMPLQFPWTPGLEGAGIVEAVGANVTNFKKGDAVYGILASGGYAEYALALASDIQPKPESITFEQAAALPVGVLTAWGAVIDTATVQAGQHVLVHGAAGGVGAYAVQLARWKRAHVTGIASAGNLALVRSLGVENVIDYNATRFETVVHDMDVVIDTVGGDLSERSFQVLRPGGIYVTVAGRLAADAGKAQNVRATHAGRATPENLKKISELIEAKQLHPITGEFFPLAQAQQAQALSQGGHGRGRIILQID